MVNARAAVIARLPAPPLLADPPRPAAAATGTRRVFLDRWRDVPVFDFVALAPGQQIGGPALVESDTTTVLLRPGDAGRFDPLGWLGIAIGAG